MIKFLKNHPFAVEAHFDNSLVLTFAVPKAQLKSLVPKPLELDTYKDKWAFIAIAMVQTSKLRPRGFPKFMGNDFFLIGYRIFVLYRNNKGKSLRGLYILKSQTNKKRMEFLGNIFTHYKYTTIDVNLAERNGLKIIKSAQSNSEVIINNKVIEIEIPDESPFDNWKDARKFAGPLPFTFTVSTEDKTILSILGIRENWKPKPVKVESFHFDFLDKLNLQNIILANAFEIKNVPYYWEKGKVEKWE